MNRNKTNTEDIKKYIKTLSEIDIPTIEIKAGVFDSMNQLQKNISKAMESYSIVSKQISESTKPLANISKQIQQSLAPTFESLAILSRRIQETFPERLELIKKLAESNNGIVTNRMIEPLNISREYLSYLKNNKELEKVGRGIYQLKDNIDDKYYEITYKYKKAVFSHMCALNLYGLTEQIQYKYTVTVPSGYHIDSKSVNCNVYYVRKDIYELGLTKVNTPSGNLVKAYDMERCICDIIKSKKIDPEQVKKSVKKYLKRKEKDLDKLSKYSKKLNCYEKAMEYVRLVDDSL